MVIMGAAYLLIATALNTSIQARVDEVHRDLGFAQVHARPGALCDLIQHGGDAGAFQECFERAASCFGAFTALEKEKMGWMWTFIVTAVLFNPILPIHLSRNIWQPVDLVGGIVFLCSTLWCGMSTRA